VDGIHIYISLTTYKA